MAQLGNLMAEILPLFQSQRIADCFYDLDWSAFSLRDRRTLLLMINVTQAPICLKAGLFTMSLSSFVAVS